ncbi:hypothetical protein MMC09_002306 [Bachmanniomyces sp. S44760]|nr:hypothetical protein [Bachmanniomyces sp. S44760]
MGLIANPIIPDDDCTLATCSLLQAHFLYLPSLAGNALFVAMFAIILFAQVGLGIRYKTWGFLGGMFGGLLLEVIGYAARIELHFNPFKKSSYLICDFLSLLLQAAGGAIASGADTISKNNMGRDIMVAGLGFQVGSLALFIALTAEFALRAWKRQGELEPSFSTLRSSFKFRAFLFALALATVTIFTRCCFRVGELSQGFHGKLANQEVTYMVLEGAMVCIAVISLTVFHPGVCFQSGWNAANFKMSRTRWGGKGSRNASEKSLGEDSAYEQPIYSNPTLKTTNV